MTLTLKDRTDAAVATPTTAHLTLYRSATDGLVKTKDSTGVSSPLGSPPATSPPPDVAASGALGAAPRLAKEDHTHGLASSLVLALIAAAATDLSVNGRQVTNAADPQTPQALATKAYVDAVAQGLHLKQAARAATTAPIALSGTQTIDAVALVVGNRVLVKDQSNGVQNGIYAVASGAWTRTTDFAVGSSASGDFAFIEQGTINGNNGWVCTNDSGTDVVGTDVLVFAQFSGAGQIVAGAALTKSGNQLDVAVDDVTIEVSSDALRVKDAGLANAKLANMAASTFKGRAVGGGTGAPQDLTATQATAALDLVTVALKGLASAAMLIKANGSYSDIVADWGADPLGVVDATAIIQNAANAFSSAGGRLYFPAGTYKITGTITVSKPVIFCGAGRSISNVQTTSATATMFLMATGAAGGGFEQMRLSASAANLRTAGFAVDMAAIANVYMQQCDILFQWSSVRSAGPLQFLDDMNIREGGANAANGAFILVDSTGDRYFRRVTTDNPNDPTGFAGIRIRSCSSCVISDSNLINSTNALDIVPNGGLGTAVASVLVVNTFFDSSVIGANIVPASGNDTAHRIRFINCWFSTCTTAGVVINHANVNSVDFVGCDFYQNPVGIDALACTEWSVRASRFAGNTTAGIRTTAGATHSFTISDNFLGNGAGFGANGLGINVQAGTYKRYQILDNRGLETNTTPGITDLGTVGAADQKNVANNMGADLIGGLAASAGAVGTITTVEVQCVAFTIPANLLKVGTVFRVTIVGVTNNSTTAGTIVGKVRIGPTGALTENIAASTTVGTRATAAANIAIICEMLVRVASIGAGGTIIGSGGIVAQNLTFTGNAAAVSAAVAVDTTASRVVQGTLICTGTSVNVIPSMSTIEVVNP